jgi:hypothetical protein
VISEADLLTRLWAQVPVPAQSPAGKWKFLSSGASGLQQRAFGTRVASVARAVVNRDVDQSACWIESVDSGWLFLLPRGENEAATLIAVGETPGVLLGQSRIVAGLIGALEGPAAKFAAYPRIADPLCGDGWLACGAAAIGFDPLCGEGTGNAARQAYLATAIIAAVRKGEPVEDLLAHYRSRQMHGFLRHLQICLGFYQSGGSGAFWKQQCFSTESNGPGGFYRNMRNHQLIGWWGNNWSRSPVRGGESSKAPGVGLWYPTSREKRARYGAPGCCCTL